MNVFIFSFAIEFAQVVVSALQTEVLIQTCG